MKHTLLFVIGSVLSLSAFAQASPQESIALVPVGSMPVYVRERDQPHRRSGQLSTSRRSHGSGSGRNRFAAFSRRKSQSAQQARHHGSGSGLWESLQSPTTFGAEYLTYVMWAISPDGHAVNLGEVLIGGNDRSKLTATTDLQAFALIVTAEPYFAVRQPSNVVVLENVVRADTKGTSEAVNAKYELMERGGYIPTGYKFDPVVLDAKLPLEFLEARNAVRIAKSEGAEQYAGESYQHAVQLMNSADAYATEGHSDQKQLIAESRETVQTAEDAREIAVKKIEEDRRADERQASADAQAQSQAQADSATRQKEQAQIDAANAQAAAANAQADTADAQAATAKAQADAVAQPGSITAAVNAAQADADQARLDGAASARQRNTRRTAKRRPCARNCQSSSTRFLRRATARAGSSSACPMCLFDTGQYSLKPGAREKLAKVAGILIAYPALNIAVGGYTDNVGGDEMNQKLSENRAGAVRDYLVQEGVVCKLSQRNGLRQ